MNGQLLNLEISEHAQVPYSSLGPEDRSLVDAGFDRLRNWRNDPSVRARSRRLGTDENLYMFQDGADLVIAFKIDDDTVTIVSLFREETLRKFAAPAGRGAL
jgi:hypothetical protein